MKILHDGFRTFLFMICLIGLQGQSSGNNPKLDSLKQRLLKHRAEDTARVNLMNNLVWEYQYSDPEEGIKLARSGLRIAEKLSYAKGKSEAYLGLGVCYAVLTERDSALENYERALRISESLGESELSATIYLNIGNVYFTQADFGTTMQYYEKALKVLEKAGNKSRCAGVYGNIGNVYYVQGDYPKSSEYQLKSLELAEETRNLKVQANALSGLGNIYLKKPDYPKALEYFYRSLRIHEQTGNKKALAGTYGSIGVVYYRQKAYLRALEKLNIALQKSDSLGDKRNMATTYTNIGNVYSDMEKDGLAFENFRKALHLFEEMNFLPNIASTLNNMGRTCLRMSEFSIAKSYYDRAYEINQSAGIKSGMVYSILGLGGVYLKQFETTDRQKRTNATPGLSPEQMFGVKKAIGYFRQAVSLGRELNELDPLIEAYDNLARASELLLDWENAYRYLDSTHTLQDSVFNLEKQQKIASIEEQRVAEINRQKQEISELTIRNQWIALGLVSIGLVLMFVLVIHIYQVLRSKRKYNRLLESEVQLRTFELQLSNDRLKSAMEELENLDNARNEFLRTIHHEIRTPLNGILGPVDILKTADNPLMIKKMIEMIDVSVHRLEHFLLRMLSISELRTKGDTGIQQTLLDLKNVWAGVINQLTSTIREKKLVVNVIEEKESAPVSGDLALITICFTELLTNAIRHSPPASQIRIVIAPMDSEMTCLLTDQGPGFDTSLLNAPLNAFSTVPGSESGPGLGLYFARLIVEAHHGTLRIANNPEGGACVQLSFPLIR